MVEELIKTDGWTHIAESLITEGIASVSGRKTNGRWHHGSLTTDWNGELSFYAGYQKALMDFNNRLLDFIKAKDNLKKKKIEEDKESKAPIINPFLEDINEWLES